MFVLQSRVNLITKLAENIIFAFGSFQRFHRILATHNAILKILIYVKVGISIDFLSKTH